MDRRLRFDAVLLNPRGRVAPPAPSRLRVGGLALGALLGAVLAGCSGTLATTLRAPARAAGVPANFECSLNELRAMGYSPSAFDRGAGRLVAQKADPTARRPLTLLRRVLDRLEVEAAADQLVVRARTVLEFESRRGPTEEEESASSTARADARTLLERCGLPARP